MSSSPSNIPHDSGAVLGLTFVVVWCSGYIAGKWLVAEAAPFTSLVWRFGLAAILFFIVSLGHWKSVDRRVVLHSAVVGALMLVLHFGGVYGGLALGASSGIAALVIGTMPLFVALIANWTGNEELRRGQWLGLALGLAGVVAVVADRIDGATPWPAWIALCMGLLGISAGTLYQKRFVTRVDMRVSLALQNGTATLLLLPLALFEGFYFRPSAQFFGAMAWVVLVNSVGGFVLLFLLIRRGAATRVAALFFLMPPVTAILGFFTLGEHLTWLKASGFLLAALGLWLAGRAARIPAPE